MPILRSVAFVASWFVVQSIAGCGGKDVTSPPPTAQPPSPAAGKYLLSSSSQLPVAGSSVTITAQLVDAGNAPLAIAGRVVSWSDLGSPGGSFADGCTVEVGEGCHSATSRTDAGGKAIVVYTTSIKAGASDKILATDGAGSAGGSNPIVTIVGPPAKYSLSVNAPPVVLAGNTVRVYANLLDINGNPVHLTGRVVAWTDSGTGGSFSSATSLTDINGVATVNFRTSTSGGVTHVVTASDSTGFKASTREILTIAGAQGFIAQAVVAGSAHSCVLDSAGIAACWGVNAAGQLGNGLTIDFPAPVPVSGTLRFVSLAAGSAHTCGISTNGDASCWGSNSAGQLGNNTISTGLKATPVGGGLNFVSVTAGTAHTCGIVLGGAAYCWGDNSFGQLGTGSQTRSLAPIPVQGGLQFVALSAGANHTCGIVDSGKAYCWGDNQFGQVGDGSTTTPFLPTAVYGGLVFSALSSGGSHTCGVAADGAAYCWGNDGYGQLGDGAFTKRAAPYKILAPQRFTSVSAGFAHTCGVADSGVAYCWGSNATGELGNGKVTTSSPTPAPVAGNLAFASIDAGGGDNYGSDYYYGPQIVSHTCGVTMDRTVYCWGYNGYGEIGNNSGSAIGQSNPLPVKVAGQR